MGQKRDGSEGRNVKCEIKRNSKANISKMTRTVPMVQTHWENRALGSRFNWLGLQFCRKWHPTKTSSSKWQLFYAGFCGLFWIFGSLRTAIYLQTHPVLDVPTPFRNVFAHFSVIGIYSFDKAIDEIMFTSANGNVAFSSDTIPNAISFWIFTPSACLICKRCFIEM